MKIINLIVLFCVFTFLTLFIHNKAYGNEIVSSYVGIASYYSNKLHGKLTANGEIYDMNSLTAAHRKLKFGTHVIVTNLMNNRKVKVKINDRGPFIRNRKIDLSYAAAKKIGMIKKGITKVKIDVIKQ